MSRFTQSEKVDSQLLVSAQELSHIPRPGQTAEETQPAGTGTLTGGGGSNAVASSSLRRTAESTPEIEEVKALRKRIDVVDCTSMDTNVNGMRHGFLSVSIEVGWMLALLDSHSGVIILPVFIVVIRCWSED